MSYQLPFTMLMLGIMPAVMAADRPQAGRVVRFATFNASLNRSKAGELLRDLSTPDDVQARNVAEIIQRSGPDILLINEFDHDAEGRGPALFQDHYLSVGQNGAAPISYPYRYSDEVNTGVPSGFDLDGDGQVSPPGSRGYGNDALGFGLFPGQYGMVLYSKYPIDRNAVRRFQKTWPFTAPYSISALYFRTARTTTPSRKVALAN